LFRHPAGLEHFMYAENMQGYRLRPLEKPKQNTDKS
jgi:hypothetical protein